MTNKILDADEVNKALQIIKSIREVPNPAYKKATRDLKAFSPQRETIRQTNQPVQPSLGEQMATREKRYTVQILNKIVDICDNCPDCSDCSLAMEIRAADMCERVKRNLIYIGAIEK